MYSRKLGVTDTDKSQKSLESFNRHLREQYSKKRVISPVESTTQASDVTDIENGQQSATSVSSIIDGAKSFISNLDLNLDFETFLIIGLILLILTDADTIDLVLLGILISLIL